MRDAPMENTGWECGVPFAGDIRRMPFFAGWSWCTEASSWYPHSVAALQHVFLNRRKQACEWYKKCTAAQPRLESLSEGGVETRFLRRHQSDLCDRCNRKAGNGTENTTDWKIALVAATSIRRFLLRCLSFSGCATPKFLLLICEFSPGRFCAVRLMGLLILGGCWQGIRELADAIATAPLC
jgi:hypothetical protein